MPSTSKRGVLAPTNSKQHMNPHMNGQAVSPGRNGSGLPLVHHQQQQQPLLQPHSSQPMVGPLPSKAASVQQLSAVHMTEARPPLQRYITAPAGSIASKVMSQPPPLQPLSQHGGYSQVPQPQQRSRPSSGGGNNSQQPSPSGSSTSKASSQQQVGPPGPVRDERDRERERAPAPSGNALVPSGMNGMGLGSGLPMRPTRGTWRFSGDGEAGLPPTITRQLSGTVNFQTYSGAAAGGGGAAMEQGRGGPDHVTPSLRAPQQRTTWNGAASAAQPSQRSGASNGGGSNNNSTSGQDQGQSRSSSMNGQEQGSSTAAHRKAHSLAGNEGLHVNGGGGGSATLRNGVAPGGLTGLQGRSLAPAPASSSGQSQATHPGFPSANAAVRLSPSPPPGSYGGPLRSTNSASLVQPAAQASQGRGSHDGMGNGPSGQLLLGPSVHGISIVSGGGGGGKTSNSGFLPQPGYPGSTSSMHAGGLLEPEASDSSCYADASAYLNDGRRASDTVLYAAAALKEAKHRLDKASNMISGTSRPPGLLDGVPVANGGAVGGTLDGGSRSVGLGVLRAPSFGRTSGPPTGIPNGPPSPDTVLPSNLPPLMGGTPRRISAPESSTTSGALAALNNATNGGGTGALGAGSGSNSSRALMGSSHPPSGGGYLQRHNNKQQHQQSQQQQANLHGQALAQLPSMGSGDSDEGAQAANISSNGASHGTFLPALEVGKPGSRIPSASLGSTSGVGVGRRPSKGSLRSVGPEAAHCKREEAMKALALEAVPEAGVL